MDGNNNNEPETAIVFDKSRYLAHLRTVLTKLRETPNADEIELLNIYRNNKSDLPPEQLCALIDKYKNDIIVVIFEMPDELKQSIAPEVYTLLELTIGINDGARAMSCSKFEAEYKKIYEAMNVELTYSGLENILGLKFMLTNSLHAHSVMLTKRSLITIPGDMDHQALLKLAERFNEVVVKADDFTNVFNACKSCS